MSHFIVMCRVSGGVTGTREAPLKDLDGNVARFPTFEAAQTAARRQLANRSPYSICDFRYWPEEQRA